MNADKRRFLGEKIKALTRIALIDTHFGVDRICLRVPVRLLR